MSEAAYVVMVLGQAALCDEIPDSTPGVGHAAEGEYVKTAR
ncbi:hypothetical protein [Streptomyces sp. NL15-2K]|nr:MULTISPECIES: hypothetical protein [Actinomycetes]WKX06079.1 hypothetical protein Q4V64_00640 [Kutzneria buriramensis]GCB52733.1 hypothetical protein SNL152K_10090 [Streptomyces sp. NL15-2K]